MVDQVGSPEQQLESNNLPEVGVHEEIKDSKHSKETSAKTTDKDKIIKAIDIDEHADKGPLRDWREVVDLEQEYE